MRIAAMGDLHFGANSLKTFSAIFKSVNDEADIMVLCGDLTMRGLIEEARGLSEAIADAKIPILAVLGNHDHEANNQEEIMDILGNAGMTMLERGPFVTEDGKFGFVGTKGFCGGFTGCKIAPFGERILKMFINETFKEANTVNRALKTLKADFKVVVYHYAPIRETCNGEHCELLPFLGSSILADPPDTFNANLVLHGHAHHGSEKGQTETGIPVRNVALPIHNKKYVVYDTASFSDHKHV
jgi:uncharacterized protein